MVERGVEVCALEVSSHALVLGRVDGVVFDLAVFTNLGRDHLDFHVDVESYFAAKADLFTPQRARRALVVVDDEHGRRLAGHPRVDMRTLTSGVGDADWRVTTLDADDLGSTFTLTGPAGQRVTGSVPLPGAFNVVNAGCALASLAEVGVDLVAAAEGIASAPAVAGRMERVACGQAFTVVVDYAHKPDAVAAALKALRPVTDGRLLVVIGAGGDRDRGKRQLMGEIAARLADVVVVTDDNPRSEDPAVIRAELVAGANAAAAESMVVDVADRRAAIHRALVEARPGDVVLIAGKGHETGQDVGGQVLPFDDREVARSLLDEIVAAGASQ
jgi:UDP-N-acetylmuramoyl-L-alanyl-D-glutamate--2,6-diaminopimelate ligase